VTALLSKPEEVEVAAGGGGLKEAWFHAFRLHQAFEVGTSEACAWVQAPDGVCNDDLLGQASQLRVGAAGVVIRGVLLRRPLQIWQQHGVWVTEQQPEFGPGVRERFQMASGVTRPQFEEAAARRAAARQRLAQLLGPDGVLMLPTAPGPAPLLNTPAEQLDAFRTSLISLTCISGLSGFPQVRQPAMPVSTCSHARYVGLHLLEGHPCRALLAGQLAHCLGGWPAGGAGAHRPAGE
jgi:amidase